MFAGVSLGHSATQADDVGFDSGATAFKVFGGYAFSRYLAAEVDYANGGDAEQDFGPLLFSINASGFSGFVVGTLPLPKQISLFAKLGYAFYELKTGLRLGGNKAVANERIRDFTYGGGGALKVTEHLSMRVEYDLFNIPNGKVTLLSLGGVWRF